MVSGLLKVVAQQTVTCTLHREVKSQKIIVKDEEEAF